MGTGLVVGACSSQSHPPALGDNGNCVPTDAGCASIGSTTGDGGSNACTVDPSQSQCNQCANVRCCPALSACFTVTACANLYNCVAGCGGLSACVTSCNTQYPTAVTALENLDSCVAIQCPVCTESGVGDPCSATTACITGLSCRGSWCTKPCGTASDCAGLGANGGNYTGQPSACMLTSAGRFCAPGCATNTDCVNFPDTFCASTTSADGLPVSVCGTLPDGG